MQKVWIAYGIDLMCGFAVEESIPNVAQLPTNNGPIEVEERSGARRVRTSVNILLTRASYGSSLCDTKNQPPNSQT